MPRGAKDDNIQVVNSPLRFAVLLLAMLAFLPALGGCAPSANAAVLTPAGSEVQSETSTATLTPTQTGTIQWFPATRTPTPPPVFQPQATPERRPGIGKLVLQDDFTKTTGWNTGQTAAGSISLGGGSLTLAIPGVVGNLYSLRANTSLTDFYLEITATLNLCRGDDSYGLLLRAASAQDYYRLLINCEGKLRLERVKNGYVAILQDWTLSGQVPPGSPLVLRIGFFAVRGDLRVFVNDIFQFSAADTVFTTGTVGVFARSSGANALTVNFSDLQAHLVDPARVPTDTPLPTITPTPANTRAPTWTVTPTR